MSYDYEDELERMKRRKRPTKKRESDFINRHQEEFEERKIRRAKALKKRRKKNGWTPIRRNVSNFTLIPR